MTALFLTIAAYLIGSIPVGIILARFYGGKDITTEGSGNIGATNVARVVGKKAGIITLIGDSLKGVIPISIAIMMEGEIPWLISLIGLAAFAGHLYPIFNGFKGGKGVATALGIFLIICPQAALAAVVIFAAILFTWRFVSLGSVVAAGIMPALIGLFATPKSYIILAVIIGSFVIYRHLGNIKRLAEGNEPEFTAKKEESVEEEN